MEAGAVEEEGVAEGVDDVGDYGSVELMDCL